MSAEIIPFDFEEQAVRVVMRDEEPWFVAADICRVLEIQNPTMAVKGLDEDEFTLSTIEGSHRPTNLINESGLYALVLTSRKEAAKRFRKWITSEVLPAIRRTGRYEHPGLPEAAPSGERAVQPSSSWTGITILMGGAVVCAHRQGRCGLGRTAICREKGETRRGRAQGWCSRELAADAPFADPGARVGRGE